MERETLLFRKVCNVREKRDIVRSFLAPDDFHSFLMLFFRADVTFYERGESHDLLCELRGD